jgi:hypothetical protein
MALATKTWVRLHLDPVVAALLVKPLFLSSWTVPEWCRYRIISSHTTTRTWMVVTRISDLVVWFS